MDSVLENGQLSDIYKTAIEPQIGELAGIRKSAQMAVYYGIGVFLLLILFISLVSSGVSLAIIGLVLAVIGLIVIGVRGNKAWKLYHSRFKEQVVREVVKLVNPDWTYHPTGMMDSQVYYQSDIFRKDVDRYNGDDLVQGVLDKTDFECSELHTEYKQVTTDSKGRRQERWVTIFRGLFFHADFNKEFIGRTYVSPDTAERLLGKFGRRFQKISGPAPLVVLENVAFEKAFVVHATDQIEARYILTPTIMEAMLRIKQLYNCHVHFSFIGSRVYCALGMNKALFEPKLFGAVINLREMEDMYHLFKVNEVIIKELNLNTRIWTKV
jgi:hypothetical protein